ncbi:predicted protein [Phaeodactylum tricornutum CCAP 1055/1]|jgi:hypothetical protein|uniref:Uncharacterized protein n=1 Tax=Phaeodactylum tricornutum (strain CCAP 1055/1) TaxID=556484 RepID=B7GCZ5_PHATC|nr:predicted protein [Phaeodactylum tricornutum CCAP 1055/1]EEC43409.1 predicted protein [Phaeodactylum tricornutum CCAP 1055/1]|eukprot:XP_002184962.1 predicted protein [Phaeodactylum tricornutum CCAP 1055/1]
MSHSEAANDLDGRIRAESKGTTLSLKRKAPPERRVGSTAPDKHDRRIYATAASPGLLAVFSADDSIHNDYRSRSYSEPIKAKLEVDQSLLFSPSSAANYDELRERKRSATNSRKAAATARQTLDKGTQGRENLYMRRDPPSVGTESVSVHGNSSTEEDDVDRQHILKPKPRSPADKARSQRRRLRKTAGAEVRRRKIRTLPSNPLEFEGDYKTQFAPEDGTGKPLTATSLLYVMNVMEKESSEAVKAVTKGFSRDESRRIRQSTTKHSQAILKSTRLFLRSAKVSTVYTGAEDPMGSGLAQANKTRKADIERSNRILQQLESQQDVLEAELAEYVEKQSQLEETLRALQASQERAHPLLIPALAPVAEENAWNEGFPARRFRPAPRGCMPQLLEKLGDEEWRSRGSALNTNNPR